VGIQRTAGVKYQVQYSTDLTTWSNIGGQITGDGNLRSYFDPSDQNPKRFYRVAIP